MNASPRLPATTSVPAPPAPERTRRRLPAWLSLLSLLCLAPMAPADTLTLADPATAVPLGPWLEALNDPGGTLTLDDILRTDRPWRAWRGEQVSLGMTPDTWWFRVRLRNATGADLDRLLEIGYPSIDRISVYVLDGEQTLERIEMGDHFPFGRRPVAHHHFLTPLRLPADDTRTMYIQARTSGALQLPMTLWEPAAFHAADQRRQLVAGMYFGTMLIMLVYNLFVYFGIGARSYLPYVGFVLAIALFIASLTGYSYQYFWPGSPTWNEKSIGFFLATAVLFAVSFTHRFLDLSRLTRPGWVRHGVVVLYLLALAMIGASVLLPYTPMLIGVILGSVAACVWALAVGIHGWWHRDPAARQYVLAWSALLVGGVVLAGNKFSVLPQNLLTDNAVQIGSALLVALLSFALAARINSERRRRYGAQIDALRHERQAREAKEEALKMQREANRLLEMKVTERTEELRRANATLQEMSRTDGLTGLKNRRHFDQESRREFARAIRYQHPIALIFLDIDHFKRFNDSHGHLIGDDALRTVAQALVECAGRDTDLIARYGGEEFCVLLPETDLDGATAVAERIRRHVESERFRVNGEHMPLTISLGVASVRPSREEQLAELIRQADEALYRAKGAGRNQVQAFVTG